MKITFDTTADAFYLYLCEQGKIKYTYLCDPTAVYWMINVDILENGKIHWVEIMSSDYFPKDIISWKRKILINKDEKNNSLRIIFDEWFPSEKFINNNFSYNKDCKAKEIFWNLEIAFSKEKKIIYLEFYALDKIIDDSFSDEIKWDIHK